MSFKMILMTIVAILFFVFLFQNLATVTVNFLIFEVSMPRSLLLIITLAIGLLIGIFMPFELKKAKINETSPDSQ